PRHLPTAHLAQPTAAVAVKPSQNGVCAGACPCTPRFAYFSFSPPPGRGRGRGWGSPPVATAARDGQSRIVYPRSGATAVRPTTAPDDRRSSNMSPFLDRHTSQSPCPPHKHSL